ncbi:MAG TPA: hypothetical protein VFC46_15730 [Humisphaera sp.]|nr:hypothetical protein [Humisphaera sp.]
MSRKHETLGKITPNGDESDIAILSYFNLTSSAAASEASLTPENSKFVRLERRP